jgi:hypothetical protein
MSKEASWVWPTHRRKRKKAENYQKTMRKIQKSKKFKKYWHTPAYKRKRLTNEWL